MNLTKFAIQYRPVTYLLLISLMVLGGVAMFTISRREDPDLTGRFVQIIANYPGASATQVEELVTEKLERSLLEVEDMKIVTSVSRAGIAELQVEAGDRISNIELFRDEIRERVNDVQPRLPREVLQVYVNDRFTDTSVMVLGISNPSATDRQREDIAKGIRDRLLKISDITQIDLLGVQQERISVELSAQRMAQLGVTQSQVVEAISQRNALPSSGGSLQVGSQRLELQPSGNFGSEQDLERILVAAPEGKPVYLNDIATIRRNYVEPSTYQMRVNGEPAVGIAISMRKGRNVNKLGEKVEKTLAELKPTLASGTQITVVNDLPKSVDRRINEFVSNLLGGMFLIFITLYFFMGMRSALIVGSMLPMTILGTFAMMFLFGRDIQQISISALIISLGLVVDNSIVVLDNIEVKLSEGMSAKEAAVRGTEELFVPLLTSNLTTVASFLPIVLLSGGVGEFIRDLGVVTSLATLVSLVLNYTITPLVAMHCLKGVQSDKPGIVRRIFLRLLEAARIRLGRLSARALKYYRLTVAIAFVAFAGSAALIPTLGNQFFPSAERDQFTIDVWLPEGYDIKQTRDTAQRVEALLHAHPEVRSYVTYIGQSGPRFYYNIISEPPTPNYAQIVVNTKTMEATKPLVTYIREQTKDAFPEARITPKSLEQGPPIGAPVAIRLSGNSITELREAGEQVKSVLNSIPGAASVYSGYGELPLALEVEINHDQASLAGLTSTDIATATKIASNGLTIALLREGDKEIPIQLGLTPTERGSVQTLEDMPIPTRNGSVVPLRQVANVALKPQEGRIVRRNHNRTLTIYAYSDGSRLPAAIVADAQKKIVGLTLPAGVEVGYGGELEETERTFTEMLLILGLTVVANLIIVAWEFNSIRPAITILVAVPLSMTGAILGLFLARQPFGFMAFQGIIGLAGIVTNHLIVLFEYAAEERSRGLAPDAAVLEAAQKRMRPILLTVLLSILGMLPQAYNGGTLWPPFAWALINGLLMSLFLTLVVMPAFYKLISPKQTLVPETSTT